MLSTQAPPGIDAIVQRFVEEDLVRARDDGNFDIRNVAALLFARDLDAFGRLGRKAVRVVTYDGPGKTNAVREQAVSSGYGVGFQSLLDYIESQVPSQEHIEHGLRVEQRAYARRIRSKGLG